LILSLTVNVNEKLTDLKFSVNKKPKPVELMNVVKSRNVKGKLIDEDKLNLTQLKKTIEKKT